MKFVVITFNKKNFICERRVPVESMGITKSKKHSKVTVDKKNQSKEGAVADEQAQVLTVVFVCYRQANQL